LDEFERDLDIKLPVPIEQSGIEAFDDETYTDSAELALKLTNKQRAAAENYLVHWDKIRAIVQAYGHRRDDQVTYNTSSRVFNHPDVIAYIRSRTHEKSLPADRVLAFWADVVTTSIEDFLNPQMLKDGQAMFDLRRADEMNKLHLIRRIRYLERGGYELEFYDKVRVSELIAKALGMLKDTEVQVDNYVIKVVRE